MRRSLKQYAAVALIALLGTVTACNFPEEKKSVFRAGSVEQIDSSRSVQEQPPHGQSSVDEKKEAKKPQAFAKRDKVFI